MRQIHAIVNPAAGGGRCQRDWPAIATSIRRAGIDLIEHVTSRRGEAAEFARDAILHNATEVLIVGGDGTINEIVNALADPVHHQVKGTLSLMPLGSGSDFARNLGIHSVRDAMEALAGQHVISVDVGHLSFATETGRASHMFINSADLGLGACVANRVNRSRKRLGGTVAYLVRNCRI